MQMYNELVKTLLNKYFGAPRSSLTVGETAEPDGRLYYYTMAQERAIAALAELLGKRQLVEGLDRVPELRQTIPDGDNKD